MKRGGNAKNFSGLSGLGKWEFNSLDDLQAKIDETYTKWQDDIKETYSLEANISDLMKERYQSELDYLKELIDAKKEALNAEKDLHDYQKSITEKTNDINTIRKQMVAYSGDTSQEGQARLQKLQKELSEKEDALKETEYDRYISDQQDMLEKLYEEYEELLTKKLDDFMTLVQEGLETANNNTAAINDYLNNTADMNDYILETKGLFDGLSKNVTDGTNGIASSVNSIANGIKENVDRIIAAISADKTDLSGTTDTDAANNDVKNTVNSATPEAPKTHSDLLSKTNPFSPAVRASNTEIKKLILEPNNKSHRDNAKAYIKKYASKAKKDKKEYSDVNKKIYENKAGAYDGKGKVLSQDELKGLSKKLGVTYDNASKSGNLYKKLKSIKFPGFKKGGIARLVKEKGEDGLTFARNGEGFIAPEHVSQIEDLVESVPDLNNVAESLNGISPSQTELYKKFSEAFPDMVNGMANINKIAEMVNPLENLKAVPDVRNMNNDINIDMGGITMYGVNDPKEFAGQIVYSIQKYPKVQKAIYSIETDRLVGGGRLGVQRIR